MGGTGLEPLWELATIAVSHLPTGGTICIKKMGGTGLEPVTPTMSM